MILKNDFVFHTKYKPSKETITIDDINRYLTERENIINIYLESDKDDSMKASLFKTKFLKIRKTIMIKSVFTFDNVCMHDNCSYSNIKIENGYTTEFISMGLLDRNNKPKKFNVDYKGHSIVVTTILSLE